MRYLLLLVSLTCLPCVAQPRKLVVLSVDGMDHRYLRDADKLGLKIPMLRKLMREGQWAQGVEGVVPTITWPSHTTMVTGVRPAIHGIRGNRRPSEEGGEYYWDSSLIQSRTLWHAAQEKSLTTAAITWPSTVGGPLTWNLPEAFQRRRGGAMDLETISAKGTPELVQKISARYPSFAQQWMDDRTRTLATLFLLEHSKPDLLTVHFVDLDAEAHETGPFSAASNAILEYTDELIGQIVQALPKDTVLAIVSDHGFAKVDRISNLRVAMRQDNANGKMELSTGTVCAHDDAGAAWLRSSKSNPALGIGREISAQEWSKFLPEHPGCIAAFEPADGYLFGTSAEGQLHTKPSNSGVHGLWPGRPGYRASFILWGPGVTAGSIPEISMLDLAARFASILGLQFPR